MSLDDAAGLVSATVTAEHKKRFAQTFFGSLLGQSVVLLGMLLAYVVVLAVLYRFFREDLAGLRDWVGEIAFWGILLAPIVFIFVFSFLPTVFRGWRERQLRRITITEGPREGTVWRLHPYGRQDRSQYLRPDGADDRALAWLEESEETLLYLFGASGSGKSSLIAASVLPRLEEAGWASLSTRIDRDPSEQFREALLDSPKLFAKTPSRNTGLKTLLERAAQERVRAGAQPLLIVIDQFEEVLILNDAKAQAEIINLLHMLNGAPFAGLRLLCVFRSDYRELLFKIGLPSYVIGANAFELAPFVRSEAEAFMRRGRRTLSEEGYNAMFAGLDRVEVARGCYRPITLNMVGLVLERMGTRVAGDPARLIEMYLRNCLSEGRSQDFAKKVLQLMITDSGTKDPREVSELVESTKFARWQVESTLTDLESDGLVRPLDQGRTRWEVSHDFLARQIGILLGRLRSDWLRRTAPVVLPASVLAWALMLFLALEYWPILLEQRALEELRDMGLARETLGPIEGLRLLNTPLLNDENFHLLPALLADLRDQIEFLNLVDADKITSLEPLKGMPPDIA